MKFVDECWVYASSGHGGPGSRSFRREAHVPRGGPDGGDGGRGGDVVIVARSHLNTLLHLSFRRHHRGENGQPGASKGKTGRCGKNAIVEVPVGTLVYDRESGNLLGDLREEGQELMAMKGGKGGRGNARFKTSTNRAPTKTQPGEPGEESTLRFELRLLADVGLLGYPNAGKSTLISKISAARPKVADYPFTTLVPSLGVVGWGDFKSYVVADIPGLIDGAAEGAGLGHRFLRHIDRSRLLLHLVSLAPWDGVETGDPATRWQRLQDELVRFSPPLADRPQVLVLTKLDAAEASPDEVDLEATREWAKGLGLPVFEISSLTGAGLDRLRHQLGALLEELGPASPEPLMDPDWELRGSGAPESTGASKSGVEDG